MEVSSNEVWGRIRLAVWQLGQETEQRDTFSTVSSKNQAEGDKHVLGLMITDHSYTQVPDGEC